MLQSEKNIRNRQEWSQTHHYKDVFIYKGQLHEYANYVIVQVSLPEGLTPAYTILKLLIFK